MFFNASGSEQDFWEQESDLKEYIYIIKKEDKKIEEEKYWQLFQVPGYQVPTCAKCSETLTKNSQGQTQQFYQQTSPIYCASTAVVPSASSSTPSMAPPSLSALVS